MSGFVETMKKKGKLIDKKTSLPSSKTKGKDDKETMMKKVIVGEDEFCPTCMEWRAYDETTGKCIVCGRLIKKSGARSQTITDEYDLKDFTSEHDDTSETSEF